MTPRPLSKVERAAVAWLQMNERDDGSILSGSRMENADSKLARAVASLIAELEKGKKHCPKCRAVGCYHQAKPKKGGRS